MHSETSSCGLFSFFDEVLRGNIISFAHKNRSILDQRIYRSVKKADLESIYFKEKEYIRGLIEKEFESLIRKINITKESLKDKKELNRAAKENVQIANRLAAYAKNLRCMATIKDPLLDDQDRFVSDMVRFFLLRSIRYYEKNFPDGKKADFLNDEEQEDYRQLSEKFGFGNEKNSKFDTSKPQRLSDKHMSAKGTKLSQTRRLFIHNGDYWIVKFNNEETYLRNLPRIQYITRLLESPNVSFDCLKLYYLVMGKDVFMNTFNAGGIDTFEFSNSYGRDSQGFHIVGPYDNRIYGHDTKKAVELAEEIWERANDNDISGNERSKAIEEWNRAVSIFATEYKLFFRKKEDGSITPITSRKVCNDFERARSNVAHQIRNAIIDISNKICSLSSYLKTHITTGRRCVFRQDPNEEGWEIYWEDRAA